MTAILDLIACKRGANADPTGWRVGSFWWSSVCDRIYTDMNLRMSWSFVWHVIACHVIAYVIAWYPVIATWLQMISGCRLRDHRLWRVSFLTIDCHLTTSNSDCAILASHTKPMWHCDKVDSGVNTMTLRRPSSSLCLAKSRLDNYSLYWISVQSKQMSLCKLPVLGDPVLDYCNHALCGLGVPSSYVISVHDFIIPCSADVHKASFVASRTLQCSPI